MFKYDRTLNHRDQRIRFLDKIARIYRTTAFVLDFYIQNYYNCYNTNERNGSTKKGTKALKNSQLTIGAGCYAERLNMGGDL